MASMVEQLGNIEDEAALGTDLHSLFQLFRTRPRWGDVADNLDYTRRMRTWPRQKDRTEDGVSGGMPCSGQRRIFVEGKGPM